MTVVILALTLLTAPSQAPTEFILRVPFKVDGSLCIEINSTLSIYPRPNPLILREGEVDIPIHNLEDLAGKVQIEDARQALAFVRLHGGPLTEKSAMTRPSSEVFDRQCLSLSYVYGNEEYFEACSKDRSTLHGIVDSGLMAQNGVLHARVTQVRDHWLVERSLAFVIDLKTKIVDVREEVWPDGRYLSTEYNLRDAIGPWIFGRIG